MSGIGAAKPETISTSAIGNRDGGSGMPPPVLLSVTVPLNENVVAVGVGVGVGDGDVVALRLPHADAKSETERCSHV